MEATRETVISLLEAYRDGSIDRRSATMLSGIIRANDEKSDWVMQELAFSGLLAQAMDDTDPQTFLHSFLERLRAEQHASDFTELFMKTRMAGRRGGRINRKGVARKMISLWRGKKYETRDKDPAHRLRITVTRRTVLLIVTIAIILATLVTVGSMDWTRPPKIVKASQGVVIVRQGETMLANKQLTLISGDRLQVPAQGQLAIGYDDGSLITLGAYAATVFDPDKARLAGVTSTGGKILIVERGELTAQITKQDEDHPLMLLTPHARVIVATSEFNLSVAGGSTRLEVFKGRSRFINRKGDFPTEVLAGWAAVADATGNLNVRKPEPSEPDTIHPPQEDPS